MDFVTASRTIFQAFADDAGALEPPAEAAAAHDTYVTATRDVIAAIADAEDDLEDATAADEAREVFDQLVASAVFEAFGSACEELRTVGTEAEVDVDLECLI